MSSDPSPQVLDPAAPLEPQMEAAILVDDASLVQEILAAGFDPTSHLNDGLNALHRAACDGAVDSIPVLIAAGVPLEERVDNQTPLLLAAAFGDSGSVTALLEAGADVTVTSGSRFEARPIHVAARWGNVEALSAMIAWGMDIELKDDANATPLIYAAYFGRIDAVMYLLDQGADVNWRDDYDDTPLRAAIRQGYNEITTILTDAGAIE